MTNNKPFFPEPAAHLKDEYAQNQALFGAQTTIVQRFIESQCHQVAEALLTHAKAVKFTLPDRVITNAAEPGAVALPQNMRDQSVGGMRNSLMKRDVEDDLRYRLNELEGSTNPAVSTSASLLRYAAALYMVNDKLPSGRSVTYLPADADEDIPTVPSVSDSDPESAITQASDAIAEEGKNDEGRGALQVPYVPAARKFYLPQWVSFDENDKLLVGSLQEANAHVNSMQNYISILHMASSIAPYIVADIQYQKKRYGILGQLINQGRALARFRTQKTITAIKQRAANNSLNRGLSISLEYFDDQELRMNIADVEIIPTGRIMFVPAFVVRAVREEAAKRSQDTRLNPSTRKHLLGLLSTFEQAFISPQK